MLWAEDNGAGLIASTEPRQADSHKSKFGGRVSRLMRPISRMCDTLFTLWQFRNFVQTTMMESLLCMILLNLNIVERLLHGEIFLQAVCTLYLCQRDLRWYVPYFSDRTILQSLSKLQRCMQIAARRRHYKLGTSWSNRVQIPHSPH